MGEHTALPWRVSKQKARRVTGEHGVSICNAILRNQGGPKAKSCLKSEREAEENAAFIVRAVNSHYELIEALRGCVDALTHHGVAIATKDRAAAALARTEASHVS